MQHKSSRIIVIVLISFFSPLCYAAQTEAYVISTSTVWLAASAALVFLMQAGFAMLESGMSRSKNAVNVIMKNYTDVAFGVIVFWLVGYGLMFGENPSGWLGTSQFALSGENNSEYITLVYQMMFAATATTIVSGAIAERMHYWSYILVSILITGLIYPVFGGWAWGGDAEHGFGWLRSLGFIDFAGSTVVHSVGGWCALVAAIIIGPRLGRFGQDGSVRNIAGHNLPMVAMGGFILWFGWFGFNGGSIRGDVDNLGQVLLNTQLSAGAGIVGVLASMALMRQPILMTTTVNGALGGLVAITAGAANMSPMFAIITGLLAGTITVLGTKLLERARIDDVVGAVPVHGMCGAWGTLAVGLFYYNDMFNLERISVQLLGIGAAFLWTCIVAFIVLVLVDTFVGLRASKLHEQRGLDYTEHYELGYSEFQQTLHDDKK